jgi:Sap, sulfolipid-1-addressing protein
VNRFVTVQLIVLALATAVRPASLAAIYALLGSHSPRRLMVAYVLTGAAFTISFGLLVIWVFHGVAIPAGRRHPPASVEIIGGVVAIAFGFLLLSGRIGRAHPVEAPRPPSRWTTLLYERVTVRTAAVAGPATHLPGIFYLLALDLIVSYQTKSHLGLVSLLLYNGIWFSLPITALAICVIDPEAASERIKSVERWARRYARAVLVVVSFGIGTALLVGGLQ